MGSLKKRLGSFALRTPVSMSMCSRRSTQPSLERRSALLSHQLTLPLHPIFEPRNSQTHAMAIIRKPRLMPSGEGLAHLLPAHVSHHGQQCHQERLLISPSHLEYSLPAHSSLRRHVRVSRLYRISCGLTAAQWLACMQSSVATALALAEGLPAAC